ncbi:Crp/Fnr family transcriptional regulator [Anaerotignum sp. MB30-C6]|uniref:Crp/Fnr family transcriptional regulator n=1 Tax=Anaerotignum sp. MB30-C6 TaxID=3070814 RepID=UPI0027DB3FD8|nr:Crp/Fnr family transcriptional regulator [Anaerotignum sp. MB30-C6]WMI79811.1 Crp/Fnr family transcriptional regulator [Anaerotignum sp. MB30-C6]
MLEKLKSSPLFSGMELNDIKSCLSCSGSSFKKYEKEQHIFMLQDEPSRLFILVEGSINICRDSIDGKRNIITTINQAGDLFGEVFLFINKKTYDNYAVAATDVVVLKMPKEYLYNNCPKSCGFHTLLISNMLSILANKAYFLSQKLNIVSSQTLRQKVSKLFLNNASPEGEVNLTMNREELADFLNVARPSLSRELMKMQEEGLIEIKKRKIFIQDLEKIQNIF